MRLLHAQALGPHFAEPDPGATGFAMEGGQFFGLSIGSIVS